MQLAIKFRLGFFRTMYQDSSLSRPWNSVEPNRTAPTGLTTKSPDQSNLGLPTYPGRTSAFATPEEGTGNVKLVIYFNRVRKFLLKDLWQGGTGGNEGTTKTPFWITALRVAFLVVRGFVENRCPVRAAALAYTTILGLIPMLAITFLISTRFLDYDEKAKEVVDIVLQKAIEYLAPQLKEMPIPVDEDYAMEDETPAESIDPDNPDIDPETLPIQVESPIVDPTASTNVATNDVASAAAEGPEVDQAVIEEVVAYIRQFIDRIRGGGLGIIGTVMLIFVAISLVSTIEHAFNDIFGVHQGRSFLQRIFYYWTILTLIPLIILVAYTIISGTHFLDGDSSSRIGLWLVNSVRAILPFLALWFLFGLMYWSLPNTLVQFRSAFIGAMIAGSLWQINNIASTIYISRVVTYSKIYGGLGAIPVLLFGIYLSWLIILLGAQVTHAAQNIGSYVEQIQSAAYDATITEQVGLWVMLRICQSFIHDEGGTPPTVETFCKESGVPSQVVTQVLYQLVEHRLVRPTHQGRETSRGYQPARDPDFIFPYDVLRALRTAPQGSATLNHLEQHEVGRFARRIYRDITQAALNSGNRHSFRELTLHPDSETEATQIC